MSNNLSYWENLIDVRAVEIDYATIQFALEEYGRAVETFNQTWAVGKFEHASLQGVDSGMSFITLTYDKTQLVLSFGALIQWLKQTKNDTYFSCIHKLIEKYDIYTLN